MDLKVRDVSYILAKARHEKSPEELRCIGLLVELRLSNAWTSQPRAPWFTGIGTRGCNRFWDYQGFRMSFLLERRVGFCPTDLWYFAPANSPVTSR
jgi:hypothetical protein